MSTRSLIAAIQPDGTYLAIYCHSNGYPEYVGKLLTTHYTDPTKIAALMALGDLSSLGAEIGEQHEFGRPQRGICTAYGRDRAEEDTGAVPSPNFDSLGKIADGCGAEWLYVFDGKTWQTSEVE